MQRVLKFSGLALLVLVLAACQALGGGGGDEGGDEGSGEVFVDGQLVQWERDPYTVIFRAEVVGGTQEDLGESYDRNQIPDCTIYGDNRIVYTVFAGDNTSQVLEDRLTDGIISRFVEDLAVAYRIYTYDARAELQPPGDLRPVVEQLTLNVNGNLHVTDVLSDWEYSYYEEILERCRGLSEAPAIVAPQGAWVSAQAVEFDTAFTSIIWEGDAEGSVNFATLAESGEREWITGNLVTILWEAIRNNPPTLIFEQAEGAYRVALEIPGVTREAPPPPDAG